jgi:hypothetical protein
MTTAQTTLPELLFKPRDNAAASADQPRLSSRLRALGARVGSYFESHDDYFAEIERSFPPHVREQRRQRRQSNSMLLLATLCR